MCGEDRPNHVAAEVESRSDCSRGFDGTRPVIKGHDKLQWYVPHISVLAARNAAPLSHGQRERQPVGPATDRNRNRKQVFRCGFALLLRLHVRFCHDQRAIRLHTAANTMVKQSSGSHLARVVVTRLRGRRAPVCETDASSPDVTPIPYATRPIPINLGSFFRRSTQDGVRARPRFCFIARP